MAEPHFLETRIATRLNGLKAQGRKALIPYICTGDPFADTTAEIMHALVAGGADVIELGVPFSDPMADGPVIQRASQRALERGVGLSQVFAAVAEFRQRDNATPVVLMGYANPVERYAQRHGAGSFARDAATAGVDGVLVVDYPPEECEAFAAELKRAGLDLIFLLAPTSTEARIEQVSRVASGYVYYVALKGVTGSGHLDVQGVAAMMPRIRRHMQLPVGVGFGISDAAAAQAVGRLADAIVIGSRLVQILEASSRAQAAPAAQAFMSEIRAALDELPVEGVPR